jgi:hypothetical protein
VDLKTAIYITLAIVGVGLAMALGDYLGYKVGRLRLVTGIIVGLLASIVICFIYAAINIGTSS